VFLMVLTGVLILSTFTLGRRLGLPDRRLPGVVRWWHGRLCRALGLRVQVSGRAQSSALLIANHVSWLDIPVLGSQGPIGFLSKSEVRGWPLVGWMSAVAGTLFITRGGNQTGATGTQILERTRAGMPVVVFAEGTTGDGHSLRRFHPRLFAVAQQPGVRVQPVAVRYGSNREPSTIAPFIGDDALLPHLIRVLRTPGIEVQVSFLPLLDDVLGDRRAMAEAAREAIATALGLAEGGSARAPRAQPASAPLATGVGGDIGV
jgi:1-acyl-sn-glycerol-3-phosphate acyltransferase